MIKYTVEVQDDGSKFWYLNDELHREDGPAVEYANGSKAWFLKNKSHREDGPAVEYANGYKAWYLNDELHREDGPAVEYASGRKSYSLNGKELTETEFKRRTACSDKIEVEKARAAYDILEDVQKALCEAGGKFFRKKELLAMPFEKLISIFAPNGITMQVKYDRTKRK